MRCVGLPWHLARAPAHISISALSQAHAAAALENPLLENVHRWWRSALRQTDCAEHHAAADLHQFSMSQDDHSVASLWRAINLDQSNISPSPISAARTCHRDSSHQRHSNALPPFVRSRGEIMSFPLIQVDERKIILLSGFRSEPDNRVVAMARNELEAAAKRHGDAVAFGYVAGRWMPAA
jgi:hypothetical protein